MKKKNKMRIVHIVQSPGGVERYLQMLFKYMKDKNCENILVCSEDYEKRKFIDLVDSYETVDMVREINFRVDLKSILKLRKIIKKYNPDIVYMHSSKAGAIGRIANLGINNISIYNPHGWAFNMECKAIKKNIYRLIEIILSPLCNEIVAISDFEKESACKKNICSANKINVIYNGIDFDEYNTSNIGCSILGIPDDAFVIGTVGRLAKQKAPEIFIKAAEKIKKDIPNAFFILVGGGELQSDIENLIQQKGLQDSVLITGWVDNPIDYINKFDLAMLLSRWEGFGLVLPEYMYAEKPIVATNVDAIPNIIRDEQNGILVPVDGIVEICEAVCRIVNNVELRNILVEQAKNDVKKRFDFQRVADETFEMYERLYKTSTLC